MIIFQQLRDKDLRDAAALDDADELFPGAHELVFHVDCEFLRRAQDNACAEAARAVQGLTDAGADTGAVDRVVRAGPRDFFNLPDDIGGPSCC